MPKGPVRISGGVMAKNQISKVSPEYPAMATLKRLNGDVVLRILISKTGTIEKAEVMRSTDPVFNQASIDAVRQWRYRPFLLNGEPVEVDNTVVVSFRL
jgi:periplasmic protein TonB